MLRKSITLSIILLAFSVQCFAQATETEKDKKAELAAQAVDFLKETSNEINALRTPENRISFNAELAALMWFHDEKQARAMFGNVINDFRQMLAQIDAQLNAQNFTEEDSQLYLHLSRATNQKGKVLQKLRKAMSVRQQIASAIAENDAVLGYEFFYETGNSISNQKMREQYAEQDVYFETKLLEQIAEQKPEKILDYARQSLKKGVNNSTFGLLEKVYKKNEIDGITFGEEVFSKLKDSADKTGEKFYLYESFISVGERNSGDKNKKDLLSKQIMREAADLLGGELLKLDNNIVAESDYIETVEKYSPGRAAQIRQKFGLKKTNNAAKTAVNAGEGSDEDLPYGDPNGGSSVDPNDDLKESFKKLDKGGKLSDEEKQKFIAQARQQIAKTEEPSAKITMISIIAEQMAKMGDQETALQFMREAESYGTQYPKNYLDFIQNWMLASGYAQVAPEKSFPILEDSIYRLNETISAFVKVGEFIDVNGEMIEDGEVQVGSFGGGMTKELLNGLGQSNRTIEQLAKADFARTKNLANRFERTELRILARMLILRAVFSDQIKENADKGK